VRRHWTWLDGQQRTGPLERCQPDRSTSRSGPALLLIDVINDLAFDGSETLVAQAEPMARRLAALAYVRDLKLFAPADCIVSNTLPITTTPCVRSRRC
jgi:hypothetical protein